MQYKIIFHEDDYYPYDSCLWMLSLSFFSCNDMKLRKWEFDGKSTKNHSGIINWLSYNQWQAIVVNLNGIRKYLFN